VTGQVLTAREVVVVRDYPSSPGAAPSVVAEGISSAIGVPIFSGPILVGVLNVCTVAPFEPATQDLEALEALADVAGTAIRLVQRVDDAELVAESEALAARTDPLTGVANRREGERLLRSVHPGDTVAFVDVDQFSAVNRCLGHSGGDQVLTELAEHLSGHLRAGDHVVRYGGDEFLLLLPRCGDAEAAALLGRLQSSWMQRRPAATFSVGYARHRAGLVIEATLRAADDALYDAKDAGRDRVVTSDRPPAVSTT